MANNVHFVKTLDDSHTAKFNSDRRDYPKKSKHNIANMKIARTRK